jgi:flavin-dependent dehydrogenase
MQKKKIVIVGSGPAGIATALHLVQHDPEVINDLVILEAQSHPRFKLCGGAVTFHGAKQLQNLGITIDAPSFVVDRLVFRLGDSTFTVAYPESMRIYERAVFDAALAKIVIERNIDLRDHHRLIDMSRVENGYVLETDKGAFFAEIVVAADGATSTVRRKLGIYDTDGVARLLRIMAEVKKDHHHLWQDRTAVFDFSPILSNIRGYMWDFPTYMSSSPRMNYGIFDSRIDSIPFKQRPHGKLKHAFEAALDQRNVNINDSKLRGHPVRWFRPDAEFSKPHVLLVGDAAGVDPLFAEGISFAMEYGEIAAEQICNALASKDYSFDSYREALLSHNLGKLLARRTFVARHLYQHRYPALWQLIWRLAAVAPKWMQQQIGASLALLPPRFATE